MPRIDIPYKPRPEFKAFHARKQRWACIVAHRRAGKTVACINDLIRGAVRCTLPNPRVAYIAPFFAQAKDVAWSYLKDFTAPIPGITSHESELRVDFPGGARVRLYGADNYERMRGNYFDQIVCDEMGDFDPRVWPEVLRPALSDRQGKATFIGTPKGRNSFFDIWTEAKDSPDWYSLMLKASQTNIVNAAEIEDARRMMTPEQFDQEYECSFTAAILGAYYGRDMAVLESDGRIASVPYDPVANVYAAIDLGIGDSTAIWWAQRVGREIHIIDYYESSGVGLDHYVDVIKDKPYRTETLIIPHDGAARELQTGQSRQQFLENRGIRTLLLENHRVEDGINAVRLALQRCWFDRERTQRGVAALHTYRADYDEKLKVLRKHPMHSWESHGADAFRYLIMGFDMAQPRARKKREAPELSWMG